MKRRARACQGLLIIILLSLSALPLSADMDWNVLDLSTPEKRVVRPQRCKECHQKIYDTVLSLPGKHSIIVLRECKKCHLADRTKGHGYRALGSKDWRQIEIQDYSKEHLVRLRNLEDGKKYFLQVEVRDRAGKVKGAKKILFEPQEVKEYWVNDNKLPALKNIAVNAVNIAVLPSADIAVEADKMVKLKIKYGFSQKYGFVSYADRYKKKHLVKLKGLYINKKYHFSVTAIDPFDNTTTSDDYTFSTEAPKRVKVEPEGSADEGKLILLQPRILRFIKSGTHIGGAVVASESRKIAVLITSNNNVTASIRFREADYDSLREERSLIHGEWGLKSRLQSGIEACVDCHFQGASHPVGMRAKGKTVVPKELPTGKGGVMTCATCHDPHGSRFTFLARVDFSKQLCTMCHKGNFL